MQLVSARHIHFAAYIATVVFPYFAQARCSFFGEACSLNVFKVFAAFVAAGPLTCVMHMKRGFGSTAAIPLLWFIVYRCMGELGMPLMWIWIIVLIVIGELLRGLIGYEKLSGIRVCVPLMSLVPMGNLAPLFLSKGAFLQRAAAEMDAEYVAALDRYGTVPTFLLVLVSAVVLAAVSERISEKLLKMNA